MRDIKFSCMWSDGDSWKDLRHTLEEMENGEHWEAMSDMPLLKKFKLKHKRQYTGLKDGNGVEIYGGDIVEIIAGGDNGPSFKMIGTVVFNEFEYCIETTDNYWPLVSWKCVEQVEVIGNIYEHPELLSDQ